MVDYSSLIQKVRTNKDRNSFINNKSSLWLFVNIFCAYPLDQQFKSCDFKGAVGWLA